MSTIGYYICVPFAWLVRLFYNLTNSYGVALILFTLVIKLIMLYTADISYFAPKNKALTKDDPA